MSSMSYMGTKRSLAPVIASYIEAVSPGPVLELFAGMSAVGRAIAPKRNIWVNDTQSFAATVCEFLFLSQDFPPDANKLAHRFRSAYRSNYAILKRRFTSALRNENAALCANNFVTFSLIDERIRNSSFTYSIAGPRRKARTHYALFSQQYSGTYFGLRQCLEIDSIRFAIDKICAADLADGRDVRNWLLSALGSAMLRTANSTGHFAQYLSLNPTNSYRILQKRRRSVLKAFVDEARQSGPMGTKDWRAGNRVYSSDACKLISDLAASNDRPAIIYADPPYTDDQYSRYYHLLETLLRYDYPATDGKGRYRKNRFVSGWSVKTKVESSFRDLIQCASAFRCDLMISYPTSGLLDNSTEAIPWMLRERFRSVQLIHTQAFQHSTMGGSKGSQKADVTEQIFLARC